MCRMLENDNNILFEMICVSRDIQLGETGGQEPRRKATGGRRGKSRRRERKEREAGVFRGLEAGDHADKTLKKI